MKPEKQITPTLKLNIKSKDIVSWLADEMKALAKSVALFEDSTIADDEDYQAACAELTKLSAATKRSKEKKDEVIGPANQIIKVVRAWIKPYDDKLDGHIDHIKGLVRTYTIESEARRMEALKQSTKLAKLDPAKATTLVARADTELAPKVSGISFVGKLRVDVVDESKVPEEYWMRVIDTKKLEAAAQTAFDAGETIPGVVITDNRTVRVTPGAAK